MNLITTSPPDNRSAEQEDVTGSVRRWRMLRHVARVGAALGLVAALSTSVFVDLGAQWLPGVTQTFAAAADNTSDQAAIQDTITRADNEQAQALAAADPSLMADTSTTQYLQQIAQDNQDLLSQGVTSIGLTGLQWGPVSVDGSTAPATTYETWTTSLSDGTSLQSRDENDYTLVQDNGVWLINSDTQPTTSNTVGSQPASATPAPAPISASSTGVPQAVSSAPAPVTSNAANDLGTSSNWAGYAATNGTYTTVSGTWIVPAYSSTSSAGTDATWVGIGGVTSQDLIQAGTQEATSGSGQTEYQAWIELLPQASKQVPLGRVCKTGRDVEEAGNLWHDATP
jgi:hypothetical protein